jgi:hypothetical protein
MVAEEARGQDFRTGPNGSPAAEWVGDNPFTSTTVLFGLGVGVGLLLGHTIAETTGHRLMHQDTFSEKLASQIRDLLKNNLPQGLMRHMS